MYFLGRHIALGQQEDFFPRFTVSSHIDYNHSVAGETTMDEHIPYPDILEGRYE